MSNLKLLNKFFLQFFLIIIFIFPSVSEEAEDIWNLEKIENQEVTGENSVT